MAERHILAVGELRIYGSRSRKPGIDFVPEDGELNPEDAVDLSPLITEAATYLRPRRRFRLVLEPVDE